MPRPDCSLPRPCLAVVAASPRMNDLLVSCGESGILQASRPSGSREISSKDRSNTTSFKTRTSWLFKTPMAIQFTAKDPNCFTPRHFTYCGWQKHEQSLIELLSKSERNRTAYVSSQSLQIFHDHIWLHHSQDQIEQLVGRFRFWILRDTQPQNPPILGPSKKSILPLGWTNMNKPTCPTPRVSTRLPNIGAVVEARHSPPPGSVDFEQKSLMLSCGTLWNYFEIVLPDHD